jgi:site-specific recombinase XerD
MAHKQQWYPKNNPQNQGTISNPVFENDYLDVWIEGFLRDRKAQDLSPKTISFYKSKFKNLLKFFSTVAVTRVSHITADIIRRYLIWLKETGHNQGGVHQGYRTIKAFLRWYWDEMEPGYRNPIEKVKAPRVKLDPLDPISIEDIKALLKVCNTEELIGKRDAAIIMTLLDTGVRASELCAMKIDDFNIVTGVIHIRHGKGDKARLVFTGRKARKAIRTYLKARRDESPELFVNRYGFGFEYSVLREILRRKCVEAGLKKLQLHGFRRAFVINMIRADVDLLRIQDMVGHADLQVLRRYAKTKQDDLEVAHQRGSPVDHLL